MGVMKMGNNVPSVWNDNSQLSKYEHMDANEDTRCCHNLRTRSVNDVSITDL